MNDPKQAIVPLQGVRLAFAKLFKAERYKNKEGTEAYSVALLWDPETPEGKANTAAINKAIRFVTQKKWGTEKVKGVQSPVRDGDDAGYEGFEGMYYVNARRKPSAGKPLLLDQNKSPVSEEDNLIYSGAICNASVSLWSMKDKSEKGINAELRAIKFVQHGERFSGGVALDENELDDLDDPETLDEELPI